jgi:hypothetical protein
MQEPSASVARCDPRPKAIVLRRRTNLDRRSGLALLITIWRAPLESEVKRAIGEQLNLVALLDRFAARFYA